MKRVILSSCLSLFLSSPLFAQSYRSLLTTTGGLGTLYLGAASVALAPLAGGGAGVASYVIGFGVAGSGAGAVVYGLSGLSRSGLVNHRGVAQEEQLKDDLAPFMQDLAQGRVQAIRDITQASWRSYLEDLSCDEELRQQVAHDVKGDASEEQKLIALALVEMLEK